MSETEIPAVTSRRALLAAAGALPFVGALGVLGSLPARAATATIAGHDPKLVPPPSVLEGWLKTLHSFGPVRNTGTAQARAFEEWLATQFSTLGCSIERDRFRLTSWEAHLEEDCAITVHEDSGSTRKLDVLAYYPFSGSTRNKPPLTGRILFGGVSDDAVADLVTRTPADQLARSIVVFDMPLTPGIQQATKAYPKTFPSSLPMLEGEPHPANRLQNGMLAMRTLEDKCRGLIFCYIDIAPEAVRYNFLPFTDKHRMIPALWTGKPESDYLKSVSGKADVTIRLDARLTPDARADTILATLKGDSDEVVLMTTQTDGPNECNENGGIGVLASASYLARLKKRRRTFVFSLPTGHYAGGPVADPTTGSGRRAGTTGVMAKWPDVIKRTVAQIQLEQMAAMEWVAVDGRWQATGRPAQEHWISTPAMAGTMNSLFLDCTRGEDPKYSRADLIQGGFPGGEGGALRAANIPGIGLMGWPHYFFRADPKGVIDKLSPQVMHNQISITTKLLTLMDRLTPEQLKGNAPISDAELFGT